MPRRQSYPADLFSLWFDSMRIAMEAPQVMAMRMAKLSQAGMAAQTEAALMVSEKVQAGMMAGIIGADAVSRGKKDGGAGQVVKMVRKKVTANRKRLAKTPK